MQESFGSMSLYFAPDAEVRLLGVDRGHPFISINTGTTTLHLGTSVVGEAVTESGHVEFARELHSVVGQFVAALEDLADEPMDQAA